MSAKKSPPPAKKKNIYIYIYIYSYSYRYIYVYVCIYVNLLDPMKVTARTSESRKGGWMSYDLTERISVLPIVELRCIKEKPLVKLWGGTEDLFWQFV